MRRGRDQRSYFPPPPGNMNQLWQMCWPHNPNPWRIPLFINRGFQPNYPNIGFSRNWPGNNRPPQIWTRRGQPNPRFAAVNCRRTMDQLTQDQENQAQESLSTSSSSSSSLTQVNTRWENTARRTGSDYSQHKDYRYVNYSNLYDDSPRFIHTEVPLCAELNFGHATQAQMPNIECNIDVLYDRLRDLRQWEPVAVKSVSKQGQEFSIMSYNVLAQCLLEGNCDLYEHCNPNILGWEYRRERLLKELQQSNADIICLQEVQEEHYNDFFFPNMKRLDYAGVYKKRTGDKSDGCAIFYKETAFALDTWQAVEFKRPCVELLDRDNVGIVALLRPLNKEYITDDQLRVCVATTHLLFNPKRGDIKLAQLQLLFAEVDRISRRDSTSSHPVIICGDMNSEPSCQIYKFLHTGKIHYEGLPVATLSGQLEYSGRGFQKYLPFELLPPSLGVTDQCRYASPETPDFSMEGEACSSSSSRSESSRENLFSTGWMAHDLNLLSVYGHMSNRMPGYREVTTQHSKASCTVDYIFYSVKKKDVNYSRPKVRHHHIKENNLRLLATYSLLTDEEVRNFGGLPNCVSPSDHLPLMAKFLLSS